MDVLKGTLEKQLCDRNGSVVQELNIGTQNHLERM
jgi:hypothetical protein